MALDVPSFVARFPEFDQIGDDAPGAITSALSTAQGFVSQARWGSRYEDGVMYKAAHLLAMSPMGENARLDKSGRETTYGVVFNEMLRALPLRGFVVGMGTGGDGEI